MSSSILNTSNTKEVKSLKKKKRNMWAFLWFPMALLLALAAGGMTGVLGSYYLNNSRYATEVAALATYRPPQVTKIYADDGETILGRVRYRKTNTDQRERYSQSGRERRFGYRGCQIL